MTMLTSVCVFLSLAASVTAVPQPPGIFLQPYDEEYFKAGESVQLPCAASGEPSPEYQWKRNEVIFNPSGNDIRVVQLLNGTLVFNSPEEKDAGIYQCFATNSLGTSASRKIILRQAKLQEFENNPAPINLTPKIGQPLTLPCGVPESVPPATVVWVNKLSSGEIDVIKYDDRVSKDREFRLRFANIRAEDRKFGLPYACVAINPILRQSIIGPLYYLSPINSTDTLARVSYLWTDRDDRIGLRGETISLKCIFAGNPTPDVHWERGDNKELPDRASLISFNQELQITDLQFEDAGIYQCWATNSVSGGYREVRLNRIRVNSRPYFIQEPQDVDVSVGTNAEFNCSAGGVPQPDIYWFINGVALRDVTDPRITGSRFKHLLENIIILENVQLTDHMVIQCNASNIFGYAFADFYLNVHN